MNIFTTLLKKWKQMWCKHKWEERYYYHCVDKVRGGWECHKCGKITL